MNVFKNVRNNILVVLFPYFFIRNKQTNINLDFYVPVRTYEKRVTGKQPLS